MQEIIVGLLFIWAMYTLYRIMFPAQNESSCAGGNCACPSKDVRTQLSSKSKK